MALVTRWLLIAAIAATVADAIAYVALITSGHVAEGNPLVRAIPVPVALGLKAAAIVYLISLRRYLGPSRLLHVVLAWALVVGLIGATSTVLSA